MNILVLKLLAAAFKQNGAEACSCNCISMDILLLTYEIYATLALEALKVIENNIVALAKLVIVARLSE